MKQKTVFTLRDAAIILGILGVILLAAGIDSIAEAIANALTR